MKKLEEKELQTRFEHSSIYFALKDSWIEKKDKYFKIGESVDPNTRANSFSSQLNADGYGSWSLFNVVSLNRDSTPYMVLEKCSHYYFNEYQCLVETKRKWNYARGTYRTGICSEVFKNIPNQKLYRGMAAVAMCQKFDLLACCEYNMTKVLEEFKNIAKNDVKKEHMIIQHQKLEQYKQLVKKGHKGAPARGGWRLQNYKIRREIDGFGEKIVQEVGDVNYGTLITKQ